MIAISLLRGQLASNVALLSTVAALHGCSNQLPSLPQITAAGLPTFSCWSDTSDPYESGPRIDQNRYFSYHDKYPDFGIVNHNVRVREFTRRTEVSSIRTAVDICRHQFGAAYKSNSLTTYDHFKRHRELWQNGVRVIPFRPRWVVVVIDNYAKLPPTVGASSGKELTEKEREQLVEVGYIFPAKQFFDVNTPLETLLKAGFRDAHPLRFDFSTTAPIDSGDFTIIDHFKQISPDSQEQALK